MHVTAKRTTYFNNKVAYKINALGLPERVARYNGYLPADLSYADFMNGKYYFGSRYYDPFFGMWISPDPAGQFANPYTYGGDPLNYIDPTGMWALGLGLVVGYDKSHGWSVGVGAAAEIGDFGVNTSLSFNQDGSKSLDMGANLKIPIQTPWVYLEINMGLGFAMNSYSGATLSTHGGVCVGEAGNCAGMELGGNLYFDRSGGFSGMTVYTELYLQIAGEGRVSTGYEAGLLGRGRRARSVRRSICIRRACRSFAYRGRI